MKSYFHPHYNNIMITHITSFFWKTLSYMSAYWWHVKIEKGCCFKGKPIFRVLPNSSITIGSHCTFNSSYRSNLIGIYSPCMFSTIKQGAKLEIGEKCGFSGTVIGCAQSIKIGKNVRCGANTMITDSDWHNDDYRSSSDRPIVIEDNVWLGYGVKILKGVHIGKNSFIGACSIVTQDIPENVIAAGNPCRVIKKINNEK
ncbi:acyltransferase [Bacteroides clarus]|uniref:Acyltransferase n=1 Tax=Bacteroides clarus TaxID=626929 RepID=A0A1Y3YRA4_9BACE|nr:acyltransferase [Bacteroides clarus]OUN99901.1 hypothetical protein B5F97_15035 [Bacteroides clarus]